MYANNLSTVEHLIEFLDPITQPYFILYDADTCEVLWDNTQTTMYKENTTKQTENLLKEVSLYVLLYCIKEKSKELD